jgi:uncharacterized OsmC-like protein
MLTTMGIYAQKEKIDLTGMETEVVKVMASSPRKIAEIHVTLSHPDLAATDEQKEKLKTIAETCPVALSLHGSVKQILTFKF